MNDAGGRDCVFCAIVAGDLPCHQVHADAETLAFMDLHPAGTGHVLVIPREHFATLYDLDDHTVAAVARAARRIALAQRAALAPEGLSMVQANGEAAGQTVGHYHVHLIPRRAGERRRTHGDESADAATLAELARSIAACL